MPAFINVQPNGHFGNLTIAVAAIDAFQDHPKGVIIYTVHQKAIIVPNMKAAHLAATIKPDLGKRLLFLGTKYFVADHIMGFTSDGSGGQKAVTRGNCLVAIHPATEHDFEVQVSEALKG